MGPHSSPSGNGQRKVRDDEQEKGAVNVPNHVKAVSPLRALLFKRYKFPFTVFGHDPAQTHSYKRAHKHTHIYTNTFTSIRQEGRQQY